MQNQLDKITTRVTGSIGKGAPEWTIYQHNGHKQIKYPGPKIPANPRRRGQQLNRRRFLQAIQVYRSLSDEQKNYYKELSQSSKNNLNPFTIFIFRFTTLLTYGSSFFGEGVFHWHNPQAAIFYYGEALYNENYLLPFDAAPKRDPYQSKKFNHSLLSA